MSYKKLQVWQRARVLVKRIYEITAQFPTTERFGLVAQMRRAVVSIASNIAEGSQRTSDKDFANFVLIAKGSVAELETQCIVASDLSYIDEKIAKSILQELEEISRMLHAFHSKLIAHNS